jgi:hypothetical protein
MSTERNVDQLLTLAKRRENRRISVVSTVQEIETAIEKLTPEQQQELMARLDARLGPRSFDPAVEEAYWRDRLD